MKLQAFDEKVESELWYEARDKIKELMELNYENTKLANN